MGPIERFLTDFGNLYNFGKKTCNTTDMKMVRESSNFDTPRPSIILSVFENTIEGLLETFLKDICKQKGFLMDVLVYKSIRIFSEKLNFLSSNLGILDKRRFQDCECETANSHDIVG